MTSRTAPVLWRPRRWLRFRSWWRGRGSSFQTTPRDSKGGAFHEAST
ncbi:vegetative cell wall protein gp1-like [Iris pallida]|uniref:Vegetative cell wall protein gp1-like n=1 Tax=Iris pallida TaxID=29817 RepID=A0AAX6HF70_IRIPA|nr:vegetative cell wall protein gp1-like [Iris pallida]